LKSETTVVARVLKEEPEPALPLQPAIPAVHLSEQHEAASLLKQGDLLPDLQLADPEGQSHSLHSLLGDRVTVVCFWSGQSPAAVQQLQDTGPEIVDLFKDKGLEVVSINYGQSADEIRKVTQETDFSEKVLMDPQGKALAQVATRYLPRTYLVDSEGKIVWFDMEYSPSTRRHLLQAIEYSMDTP
jgi:peroxiredoxin